ncbi:MAG TPA: response regulator [Rhizomicrobium sp.]|nr:response regulator [Rhizomicrobium sp.]
MSNYSLYCFDILGSVVCRDNFEADSNAEAKAIAGAICDACADEHHSHELWKGDLPIAGGETLALAFDAVALNAKGRKTVHDHMIALSNSSWPAGRSRRLRQSIAARALEPQKAESAPPPQAAAPIARSFETRRVRRGIEFSIHSTDGKHWTWLAGLKTSEGERMQGTVTGSRAVAIKLCIAAIDESLSETAAVKAPLPPEAPMSRASAPPARLGDAAPEARQVLVAEDEAMFREAAAESLKAAGFEVFQAGDGEEALAILKEHPEISLLISDVRMPYMDGYALVEASLGLKPNLKVILMSGYANTPSRLVLDRRIDTLRKPFDLKDLRNRVETLTPVH